MSNENNFIATFLLQVSTQNYRYNSLVRQIVYSVFCILCSLCTLLNCLQKNWVHFPFVRKTQIFRMKRLLWKTILVGSLINSYLTLHCLNQHQGKRWKRINNACYLNKYKIFSSKSEKNVFSKIHFCKYMEYLI